MSGILNDMEKKQHIHLVSLKDMLGERDWGDLEKKEQLEIARKILDIFVKPSDKSVS